MPRKNTTSPETQSIRIDGDIKGQVAIGSNISQSQTKILKSSISSELNEVNHLLQELRERIITEVVPEKKEPALERVQELELAIKEEKPDLTTMEYVKKWFGKNIPALAGAVTSIVIHPLVGKCIWSK